MICLPTYRELLEDIQSELEVRFWPDGVDNDEESLEDHDTAFLSLFNQWGRESSQAGLIKEALATGSINNQKSLNDWRRGLVREAHGYLKEAGYRPARKRSDRTRGDSRTAKIRADERHLAIYRSARKQAADLRSTILEGGHLLTARDAIEWLRNVDDSFEPITRLRLEVELPLSSIKPLLDKVEPGVTLAGVMGPTDGPLRWIGESRAGGLSVGGQRVTLTRPPHAWLGWGAEEMVKKNLVSSYPSAVWFVLTGAWRPPKLEPLLTPGRGPSATTIVAGICWIEVSEGDGIDLDDGGFLAAFSRHWSRMAPFWGVDPARLVRGYRIRQYVRRARKVEQAASRRADALFREAMQASKAD